MYDHNCYTLLHSFHKKTMDTLPVCEMFWKTMVVLCPTVWVPKFLEWGKLFQMNRLIQQTGDSWVSQRMPGKQDPIPKLFSPGLEFGNKILKKKI